MEKIVVFILILVTGSLSLQAQDKSPFNLLLEIEPGLGYRNVFYDKPAPLLDLDYDNNRMVLNNAAGIRFRYSVSDKFTVGSGLRYSKLGYQAVYIDERVDPDRFNLYHHHQYYFFDIPLEVSYRIFDIKKTSLAFVLGGSYHFYDRYKNKIEMRYSDHTETDTNTYDDFIDKNGNISLKTGLFFQYQIGEKINIFAEPNLRYMVTNTYQINFIKLHLYTIGLSVGAIIPL